VINSSFDSTKNIGINLPGISTTPGFDKPIDDKRKVLRPSRNSLDSKSYDFKLEIKQSQKERKIQSNFKNYKNVQSKKYLKDNETDTSIQIDDNENRLV
jgi:hypothetical protein